VAVSVASLSGGRYALNFCCFYLPLLAVHWAAFTCTFHAFKNLVAANKFTGVMLRVVG